MPDETPGLDVLPGGRVVAVLAVVPVEYEATPRDEQEALAPILHPPRADPMDDLFIVMEMGTRVTLDELASLVG